VKPGALGHGRAARSGHRLWHASPPSIAPASAVFSHVRWRNGTARETARWAVSKKDELGAMSAWRGLAELPDGPARRAWAREAASSLRAVRFAVSALRHFTLGRAVTRMRCLVIGHDDGLAREPKRLYLRCAECGRSTRGWAIATTSPRLTAPVTVRKPLVRDVPREHARRHAPALRVLRKEPDEAG